MSASTVAWASCGFGLGTVLRGVLTPTTPGVRVRRGGVVELACPRCGAVRIWAPTARLPDLRYDEDDNRVELRV